MSKQIPTEELKQSYLEILSVRKVAARYGLGHSTVWKRIGPVLPVRREVRQKLLVGKPEGMSAKEWARMHGVSVSTYYYWRRKERNESRGTTG